MEMEKKSLQLCSMGLELFLARVFVCFFAGQVSCRLRLGVVDEGRTSLFFDIGFALRDE
jgi:hypothetical protein